MSRASLPAGFELVRGRRCAAVVRSSVRQYFLSSGLPDGAGFERLRQSGRPLAAGRGGAVSVALPCGNVIIRHCQRGGILRRILGDSYLLGSRPIEELCVAEAARATGVPVPEYLAAFVWRRGFFYTGDLAVREVPGAVSLEEWLRIEPAVEEIDAVSRALAAAFRGLLVARICHPDLHAGNVLVRGGAVHLIDFDRARQLRTIPDRLRDRMLFRFNRALVKRGLAPDPVTLAARVRFCRGLGLGGNTDELRRFFAACGAHLNRHRWTYGR